MDIPQLAEVTLGVPDVEPEPFEAGKGADGGEFEVETGEREIEETYPLPYFVPDDLCFAQVFLFIVIAAGGEDHVGRLEFCVEVEEDAGDEGQVRIDGPVGSRCGVAGDDFDDAGGKQEVFGDLAGSPTAVGGLGVELLVGEAFEDFEEFAAGVFCLRCEGLFTCFHIRCFFCCKVEDLCLLS